MKKQDGFEKLKIDSFTTERLRLFSKYFKTFFPHKLDYTPLTFVLVFLFVLSSIITESPLSLVSLFQHLEYIIMSPH